MPELDGEKSHAECRAFFIPYADQMAIRPRRGLKGRAGRQKKQEKPSNWGLCGGRRNNGKREGPFPAVEVFSFYLKVSTNQTQYGETRQDILWYNPAFNTWRTVKRL